MDSSEFNKYAGALLGTLTLVMGLSFLSQALVSPKKPAKAGYELPAGGDGGGAAASTEKAAPAEPIAVRLAKADATKGAAVAKQCASCHKFEKGGANGQGPALHGIVGKKMAGVAGFGYSDVLKGMGKTWDFEALDAFIANPKAFANGTKMTFAGISRPDQRADLIAYMNSMSDAPVALPK